MNMNEDALVSFLGERIVPPFVNQVRHKNRELAEGSLEDFSDEMMRMLNAMYETLRSELAISEIGEFDEQVRVTVRGYLVASLNNALQEDHPYIIALARIEDEEEWVYIPLYRKRHSVMHEMIDTAVIPVIYVKTRAELESGEGINIKLIHEDHDLP